MGNEPWEALDVSVKFIMINIDHENDQKYL